MSSEKLWTGKLTAFLHDPVDKPFILMQGGSHEKRAKDIIDQLQISIDLSKDHSFDYIASAMDRIVLPKNSRVRIKFLDNPCVRHPLSGKEYNDFFSLETKKLEDFNNSVDRAVQKLDIRNHDPKAAFLTLWRNLQPLVTSNSPQELKKYWSVAPADTRVPNHSIFDHLKISAACYGNNYDYRQKLNINVSSLLLFTIGPVQSFIAQARKTQDLYWGSFLLSYLAWTGMMEVCQQYGPDSIVFPDLYKQPFVDYWLERQNIEVVDSNSGKIGIPTLPNRFLAILPENDHTHLENFAGKIENAVKTKFCEIVDTILRDIAINNPMPDSLFKYCNRQKNDFLEIYWSIVPWPQDTADKKSWEYVLDMAAPLFFDNRISEIKQSFDFIKEKGEYPPVIGHCFGILHSIAEKTLGARKNLRNFQQLSGEQGRKCSLCGERVALFYKKSHPRQMVFEHNKNYAVELKNIEKRFLAQGEGLCGVCFTKRCASKYFEKKYGQKIKPEEWHHFPSTAEIALMHVYQEAETDGKLRKIMDDYTSLFNKFDPELFFEENLTEKYFRKCGYSIGDNQMSQVREKLVEFENYCRAKKMKLTRYYAVVMFDGDDMGKWLAGDKLPKYQYAYHPQVCEIIKSDYKDFFKEIKSKQVPMTPALSAALSRSLSNYSLYLVPAIIKDKVGKLVYAGGDDVLALVNLHSLLSLLPQLRAAFSGHIDSQCNVDFNAEISGFVDMGEELLMTMGPEATASAGICIAHYKTPLTEVLRLTKKMEQKSKQGNKDACSIAVLKRSGEIKTVSLPWKFIYGAEGSLNKKGVLGAASVLVDKLRRGIFSDKFIYVLRQEFSRLIKDSNGANQVAPIIVETELRRLLKKSYQIKVENQFDAIKKNKEIDELLQELLSVLKWTKLAFDIGGFLSFLEIAAFIAKETGGLVNANRN